MVISDRVVEFLTLGESRTVTGYLESGQFCLTAFCGGNGLGFGFFLAFGVTAGEKDLPICSCLQGFLGNNFL